MFYKKAVLKIFAIFTEKHTPVLESLFNQFNKVAGLQEEHLQRLLLMYVSSNLDFHDYSLTSCSVTS